MIYDSNKKFKKLKFGTSVALKVTDVDIVYILKKKFYQSIT